MIRLLHVGMEYSHKEMCNLRIQTAARSLTAMSGWSQVGNRGSIT